MSVDSGSSTSLTMLVEPVRRTVRADLSAAETADAVAGHLARYLAARPVLPEVYRRADPDEYTQHIMHVEPDGGFSIVALVWLPGQHTPVHDHVSWCVTGVYEGQEREERFALDGAGDSARLRPVEDVVNPAGQVCGFAPPGDIHRVRNCCDALTISFHIYGADIHALGSSIRRRYDLPVATD